jgi:fumarate hydratase class I
VLKLKEGIVELYKKVATSIPGDVENALRKAQDSETNEYAKEALAAILKEISDARTKGRPLCVDSGIPVVFAWVPRTISQQSVRDAIIEATQIATRKNLLNPNAVDYFTGTNSGDNIGIYFPLIHLEETQKSTLTIDLLLQGADCENLGQLYNLSISASQAAAPSCGCGPVEVDASFEAIKRCVIDAVASAKGRGCPPFSLSVAIGGSRDQVAFLSRRLLVGRIDTPNADERLAEKEAELLQAINAFGMSGEGFQRSVTALSVKMAAGHRHPSTCFVDVAFACWANRKGRLIWG